MIGFVQKKIDSIKHKTFSYLSRNMFDSLGCGLDAVPRYKTGSISISTPAAMRFTAVFAAIRLRSETIASLPKTILSISSKGRIDAYEHSVYKLIKYRPNGFMNVFSFWEYTNACLDGWGNAYVLIMRDKGGNPGELIPVHPRFVTVIFRRGKKWYVIAGSEHFDGTYSDDDVLHFFILSEDGIKGVNPIVYNSAAISCGISAQDFGNEFFAEGGNVKSVLETDRVMNEKIAQDFSKKFNAAKNFGTPILDQGVKLKQVGIAPEAAQMLETRTYALQDISRIFNVPPHMLSDLSRATFSNIEHQDIQYAKYSIRPSVKRYEQEIDRKLFFSSDMGRYESKFNLNGLMRGDMTSRSNYYQKAITTGWLSRNEVRDMENMNMSDGLDAFMYPSNEFIVGEYNPNKKQEKNE